MQGQKAGEVRYIKSEDYKRHHVTGFYGGLNSHGELCFDLLEEILNPPTDSALVPDQANPNSLVEAGTKDPQKIITRMRHAEVIIPSQVLPGIITWLQEKYADYVNGLNNVPRE